MNHKNLATLTQPEMDAINLDKNVCLARHHCKGRNRHEVNEYLKTIDSATAEHIKGLIGGKK